MYGGQAVIEGVMIRGLKCCALAVRRPDGTIAKHILPLLPWSNGKLRKIPFVRGLVVLSETMIIPGNHMSRERGINIGILNPRNRIALAPLWISLLGVTQ